MLKVAVPNKGVLSEAAISMLAEAGYATRRDPKELHLTDEVNQVEFFYLRPKDIATYVGKGTLDAGITGLDLMLDGDSEAEIVEDLEFGGSSLSLAAPKGSGSSLADFDGKRIATAYSTLTKDLLSKNGVRAEIVKLDGAVENAVVLGVADAVVDVVSTGNTLRRAGLEIIGDPEELAELYFREGADELTFLDVSASLEGRKATLEAVSAVAEKVFIPLTVGGGIKTVDDVGTMLEAGADKVSISSAAIANPALLGEIVRDYGSQVLVSSIDAKRTSLGFELFTHGGTRESGVTLEQWIQICNEAPVGELLINSIDRDGTGLGFDEEMTKLACSLSEVPVIASGGAGNEQHFVDVMGTGIDAVLAAGVFHRGELRIGDVKLAMKSAGAEIR
jgi:cyclase